MDATDFVLDPVLAGDTHFVVELALSRVLLMDDARFPWLILVPRVAGMRDLIDLAKTEQRVLLDEIELCARALRELYAPLKLNIASLGNVVAQLHVHVIARHARDAAWPKPVWGAGTRAGYTPAAAETELARLRGAFDGRGVS